LPKKEKKEEKRIKVKVIPVYIPVIEELQAFQKIIDDPKKKMLVRDLRAWAGHMNYIITQLLNDISHFIFANEQFSQIQKQFREDMELMKKRADANSQYFS
jgi:hypothetical protein